MFAVAALPFAVTFALYYPDERHYTDGALVMLKDHDWLAPKTAEGAPRLQKPPLAYWSVAASYAAFGVGAGTSRLPFLLAGCGTLMLVYQMARRLTGNADTARLAAVVLLSHPQFFLCSIRSIPDALLVFFITLSAWGFLRLLVFEERGAGAFWLAYGGAAGAVLSKGLLGMVLVLFAWAFAVWKERNWRAVKKLIHLPSLVTALILAAGWLVCIFRRHGAPGLGVFFDDQVTGNFHGHWWAILYRAPLFALVLGFNFLPWSLPAIEQWLRSGLMPRRAGLSGVAPGRESQPSGPVAGAQKFILAWTAVLIIGFACGTNVSLRYLLPATPLLAVLMANWFQGAEGARLIFSVRRLLVIVLAALALADATAFFIVSQWPMPAVVPALLCGLFLAGMVLLGLGALWRKSFSAAEAMGVAILLFWPLLFAAAMPALLPDRAQQMAATLLQTQADPSRPVLLVGDLKLASRLRVLLGGKWTVVQSDELDLSAAANFDAVLLPDRDVPLFLGGGHQIQMAAFGVGLPPRGELWPALKSRQLPAVLTRHGQRYYLVTRG